MSRVDFVGQSARDASNPQANSGRLINLYREPVQAGGRTGYALRSVPGVSAFVDLGRSIMRAMTIVDGVAYAVCGGRLFSITQNGVIANLGAIADSAETTIAGNNGNVTIAAGGTYYLWDGVTLTTPSMGNLTYARSVCYIGGYTVLIGGNASSDRLIQWSGLATPGTMPGASFASSETTDEPVIRAVTVNETLVVFKATGHEVWRVTGEAGANALELIVGSHVEIGLQSFNALTLFPNGAALVSSDGRVSVWSGGLQVISTPAVNTAVERFGPDRMFYYEARGHGFICVTFKDAPAWCYDITTLEWHERAEGTEIAPWSAKGTVKLNGHWVAGYDNGKIGVFSPIPQEFGGYLSRRAFSSMMWMGKRFKVVLAELFAHVGHEAYPSGNIGWENDGSYLSGLAYTLNISPGVESDPPRIGVRTTPDGVTFGAERLRDFGTVGEYWQRITLRNLGQFRNFGVQVEMTAPVDIPLYATADLVAA